MICRHCDRYKAAKHKKGLCWSCAQIPEVREAYASQSKYGRSSASLREPTCECQPTTALPGTAAKKAVMRARAAAGQPIFHPQDPVITHEPYLRNGCGVRVAEGCDGVEGSQASNVSTILERAFSFPKERWGS